MKNLVLILVAAFLGAGVANAKSLPNVAEKVPANLKQEIADNLKYPQFAQENQIEGDVWLKLAVTEDSQLKIVELSATNQELGNYVKQELADMMTTGTNQSFKNLYYLKVKFDLISKQ